MYEMRGTVWKMASENKTDKTENVCRAGWHISAGKAVVSFDISLSHRWK